MVILSIYKTFKERKLPSHSQMSLQFFKDKLSLQETETSLKECYNEMFLAVKMVLSTSDIMFCP